jgi:hypothetical protein
VKKGLILTTLVAAGAVGGVSVASASPILIDLSAARFAKDLFHGPDSTPATPTPPGNAFGLGSAGNSNETDDDHGQGQGQGQGLFVNDGDGPPVTLDDLLSNDPISALENSNLSNLNTPPPFLDNNESEGDAPQQNPLPFEQTDETLSTDQRAVAVPEPLTGLLLVTGLLGLAVMRKRSV